MAKFAIKKNKTILVSLFAVIVLTQILIMNFVELSYDEAYYWVYSQFLDFGYYDHPPMVAISIFLGTKIFGTTEFGVRLFSLIYFIGTITYLFKIIRPKSVESMIVLGAMPLVFLNSLVAIPDAPLMFFSAMFFYQLKRYIENETFKNSIFLALSIVLMFYSKYHGLLIVLLSVLAYPKFVKKWSFWMIVSIVIALYLPHVYWQYKHDFISLEFHLFKRVEKHFDIANIFNYVGSQIILMGTGLVFIHWKAYRKIESDPFRKIMKYNSYYFLLFLFFMSFRNQIEANWTISCSLAFIIYIYPFYEKNEKKVLKYASINFFIMSSLIMFLLMVTQFKSDEKYGRLNEILGWKEGITDSIKDKCSGYKIVGDNYQITSKFSFYTKKIIPALHLGSRDSHFSILNLEKEIKANEEICYLTSKNLTNAVKIDTNYKDPIFILVPTTLEKLAERYGTTYEEIIRK